MRVHHGVARALPLEVILGFAKLDAGRRAQPRDRAAGELRVRVDAGPDRRAAEW